jgi:hypothetical protein
MAFLLPPLAFPKKRKGPIKRCNGCGYDGTRGFTKGPDGEWYHKGCFSKEKFAPCGMCFTVCNWEDLEDSIFDDDVGLRCSMCHEDELEYEERHRRCIKQDCHRKAVEEVNDGHWFCRKHIPDDAYLVVGIGGKYIN